MTTGQKAALSLLISVLLFASFAVAAFAGLFTVLETRFYQPAVLSAMEDKLTSIAKAFDEYSDAHQKRFAAYSLSLAVKKSSLPTQTSEDIQVREDLSGLLMTETAGLKGIRIIGSDGKKVHFSTFASDVLKKQQNLINYENYEKLNELPYTDIQCSDNTQFKLILDSLNDRLIYAFAFYDSFDMFQGTITFYVESQDFNRYLLMKNLIAVTEKARLLYNRGYVFGISSAGQSLIEQEIENKWASSLFGAEKLLEAEQFTYIMLSNTSSSKLIVAEVFREELFLFTGAFKILFLVCVFMTLYLTILLILNIKQDDTVFIRERIKKFQFALLNEYLETKEEIDWQKVITDIQLRRHEATRDVKKSLGRRGKKHEALVDSLLEKSWDEIFASIRKNIPQSVPQIAQINTEEIKKMLEEILSTARIQSASAGKTATISQPPKSGKSVAKQAPPAVIDKAEELTEVEELDEAEELAEVEELDEAGELTEAEELVDVEELGEAEELDEVEELSDVEELGEVEELDEAGELGDVEELTEAEELVDVEELGEAEELDEAEEFDDAEELGETGELGEVEELAEAEAAEELSRVEALGEEAVDELNEVEELGEASSDAVSAADENHEEVPLAEQDDLSSVSESAIYRSILAEELTFGDLTFAQQHRDKEAPQIHFEIAFPDFSDLDTEEQVKAGSKTAEPAGKKEDENKEKDGIEREYTELESAEIVDLINDTSPFTFAMQFSAPRIVTELSGADDDTDEVIVEKNGLFTIPNELKQKETQIDKDFMNLVDSVLK